MPLAIVFFACRDDITAPSQRPARPDAPSFAAAVPGITPQVSAGGLHTCALSNDAIVHCWGYNEYGQTTVPTDLGTVSELSTGNYHTCALATGGTATCWGYNAFGQTTIPTGLGSVRQISAAFYNTCALRIDGTVTCWGSPGLQTVVPPGLTSVSRIATGIFHTCALRTDATVVCWGYNAYGELNVPSDLPPASQVSIGDRYTCVLKTDGTVQCWGYNEFGQANVPPDLASVTQISAGFYHACALRTDHTVVCWGSNSSGQSTVPSDLTSVATISAGANHTCALRIDGTVVCWGDNGWGQTSGPTGVDLTPDQPQTISFTSVAPNPGIVGTPYTVAATGGGSGNEVVFSVPFTGSVCTVTGSTVTFLAHGTCTIAADQAAGPGFLSATQVTQSFDVLASQDVRFVSVAPNPGVTGTTYTLSAQGTASGNAVTFSSLTATVCSVEGSVATLSQAGTCTVAADQAAGNGYAAAPQATQTFTVVEPQPQSIHFTSQPPDRAIVGGSYTVIATGGNSGNEVFFNSLTPTVCLAMGSDVTFLKIGTCRIAAGQNGNTFYFPAPQQDQAFDINDVQTITFTSSPPSPAVVGYAYDVGATGGLSGNLVTFSSLSSGVCTVSGNIVNLTGDGDCIVAADQAAGAGYLAAMRKTQTFHVVQPIQQVVAFTSTPPATAVVGGTYVVGLTGGTSGNPIVLASTTSSYCSVAGNIVTFARIGTCHITADQAANPPLYLPAVQQEQTIDIYDVQAITFNSTPPDPGIAGQTYSVAAFGGLSGNPVTFSSLSPTTICTVSGSTVNLIGVGTCTVAADQAAEGGYLAAHRETQSFSIIVQQAQLINFTSHPPDPAIVGTTYTVSAPGGGSPNPVVFRSLTTDNCMVAGSTVTFTKIGGCTIAADQRGNTYFLAADQQQQHIQIYGTQSISFAPPPSRAVVDGPTYDVTATGGLSGNLVTFSSLSMTVCAVHGLNTVSFVGVGNCIIAADQAAGMGYLAAPQQTQTFNVVAPMPQVVSFSVPTGTPLVAGSYHVNVSGGASGNPVVLNSPAPTVCSVSGDFVAGYTVAFAGRGNCQLTGDQAGSADHYYLAADQKEQNFTIYDVQTVSFTSSAPTQAVVGGNTYEAVVTATASGNPVTFTSLNTSVCTLSGTTANRITASFVGAGTCAIAADQGAGNYYLAAARQIQSFNVVEPTPQVVSFNSTPPTTPLVGGTYAVSANGGGSGNPVVIRSSTSSVCSVTRDFVTGYTVSFGGRGNCQLTADQDGNALYLRADQKQQTFNVYDGQAISFTSTAPPQAVVGGPTYSLSATGGASGNPVTFSSLSTTVCTMSGSTASFVGAGTCIIAADQAGDALAFYLAAPRRTQGFTVIEPIPQTINITSTTPNPPVVGGAYTVRATGGESGNTVLFTSLSETCSVGATTVISGTPTTYTAMVSFNAAGNCTIAANQAGTVVYITAPQVTQSLVIDTRPVANAGSAQSGNEGSSITFDAGGSTDADDGDAITSYTWNFGDGTSQSVSTPTVQHVYNDNGTYVVTLAVTDSRGATSTPATTSANVANIAPAATLVAPAGPVPEGPITLSLTLQRDAAGDLSTLQYSFDCGDGRGFSAFASSPTASCYGWDNGTLTVRAQVRDKDGATSPVYTAPISLTNVAPTVTMINAPATGSVGVSYTIQYKFTDPGTKDSPWYYQPNWGDGKKLSLYTTSTQGQTITQTHTYSSPGTYTVTVKVQDKDGGTGSTSFQVTIR